MEENIWSKQLLRVKMTVLVLGLRVSYGLATSFQLINSI